MESVGWQLPEGGGKLIDDALHSFIGAQQPFREGLEGLMDGSDPEGAGAGV